MPITIRLLLLWAFMGNKPEESIGSAKKYYFEDVGLRNASLQGKQESMQLKVDYVAGKASLMRTGDGFQKVTITGGFVHKQRDEKGILTIPYYSRSL